MKDGFVKVAAATPDIRVADVAFNKEQICRMMDEAVLNGAKIVAFPELCITGYTCGDLFTQEVLLDHAREALFEIAAHTRDKDALFFVGAPLSIEGELYNVAVRRGQGGSCLGRSGFLLARRLYLRQKGWRIFRWQQRSARMSGRPFRPAFRRQERGLLLLSTALQAMRPLARMPIGRA